MEGKSVVSGCCCTCKQPIYCKQKHCQTSSHGWHFQSWIGHTSNTWQEEIKSQFTFYKYNYKIAMETTL